MLIVALTGGIAVGKSVVADVLARHGCHLHSADQTARRLMEPGQPAWEKVVARFGKTILHPDQTIDRSGLARIIFNDEEARAFLNRLIHPLVLEEKKLAVERLAKEGRVKIFVSEAALTIEAGFAGFFDEIIVVYCRPEIQIQRLMDRDHIERDEALKKIQAQMPAEEKRKYADYVVDTSGTVEETVSQSERIYQDLLKDYEKKTRRSRKKNRRHG
jgi:dephospho-CoA kinase